MAIAAFFRRDSRGNGFGRLYSVSSIPFWQQCLTICRKVWDTHTGESLHTLQHNHIVRAIAFPPQSRPQILATGGAEKKLRVFDLSLSSGSSSTAADPTANAPNGASVAPAPAATAAATSSATAAQAPSYEIGPGVHTGTIRSVVWTP